VIVIERDAKTIVITGWCAWVVAAVAVVLMTAVLAALAFLVLGIAVSVVALLLIVMPAVAIVVLMAGFFQVTPVRTSGNQGINLRLAMYGSKQ
jgi:hypothetical protein